MTKKKILIPLFVLSALLFGSWGYTGHYNISQRAALSFNAQMAQFAPWAEILADHASDADERKSVDPDEGPRHYIDIDNYSTFISTGRIPQTLDSVILLYGNSFVYDQGVLPWATLKTYDSLIACFTREDWDQAVLFASDLGHYVADGHMPLHITRNYDGQYTGNNGIHSRYESKMINAYIGQITYNGEPAQNISNINQYVFDYIYHNYTYVDSVILADDYAKTFSTNTNSQAYKQALWEYSQGFTNTLFKNASHALADLIYSAWVEAGSPVMSPDGLNDKTTNPLAMQLQNAPNPFSYETHISFTLNNSREVKLEVKNAAGQTIAVLAKTYLSQGTHTSTWHAADYPSGIYFLVLQAGNETAIRKMVMSN
jgi:hypothetical protein